MSRAFVKETDEIPQITPGRLISAYPNLVTPNGLASIDRNLATAAAEYQAAQLAGDRSPLARASQELRYWQSRRGTAQVVSPHETTDEVRFGCPVTILRGDGRRQTFQLVGEDEADPTRNLLSYVSPLARAILGKRTGDVVRLGTSDIEIKKVG